MAGVVACLKALTPEAKACLGSQLFEIPHFPFRIGRESRVGPEQQVAASRRRPDSFPNNDLYLVEIGTVLNVSREHLQIELRDGQYFLVDRGSACGTLVEGVLIGENRQGGEWTIRNNDVFIVGTSESKYVFKVLLNEIP